MVDRVQEPRRRLETLEAVPQPVIPLAEEAVRIREAGRPEVWAVGRLAEEATNTTGTATRKITRETVAATRVMVGLTEVTEVEPRLADR
jgi:hypothetical protein